jgi:RNA polymerase sigma-70 factor (ECF subfamily)
MNAEPAPEAHATLIVAIAQHRDRGAFAALFAHFAPRVKTWLQRSGSDAAQAEEMAQEVMLAVWHKAAQYDPARASAGAWIFSIARNFRTDTLRRSRLALPQLDPSDEPTPIPLADAVIAAGERVQRLRAALDGLPSEQLTLLKLTFFQGRSHNEIAALLGLPLGTVKSRRACGWPCPNCAPR